MYFVRFNNGTESDPPLRLVCATREKIEYFDTTMLGKSIRSFSLLHNLEIFVEPENTKSLGSVYNEVIEMSKDSPAILVFVHDDVLITDLFWTNAVRAGLKEFDIVGLAGTTRRLPKQASWCMVDPNLTLVEDSKYLSGVVSHGDTFPPDNIGIFGEVGKSCKLLDGVFLAANSRTLENYNLRFDERFDFHFYDLDFCRQAETLNMTMGTVPITVVHGSKNGYGSNWETMYSEYLKKWKE